MFEAVMGTQGFVPPAERAPGRARLGRLACAAAMLVFVLAVLVVMGTFALRVVAIWSSRWASGSEVVRRVDLGPTSEPIGKVSTAVLLSSPSDEKPAGDKSSDERSSGEAKPEWLGKHHEFNGKEYETAVKSGLYVTIPECQRALEAAENQAVREYLDSYLGEGAAKLVDLDARYIHRNLHKRQYTETVEASIGTMQQMHALLMIDDQARNDFHDRWRQAVVTRRLWIVGGGAAAVLAAIASAFGYLASSSPRVAEREAVPQ